MTRFLVAGGHIPGRERGDRPVQPPTRRHDQSPALEFSLGSGHLSRGDSGLRNGATRLVGTPAERARAQESGDVQHGSMAPAANSSQGARPVGTLSLNGSSAGSNDSLRLPGTRRRLDYVPALFVGDLFMVCSTAAGHDSMASDQQLRGAESLDLPSQLMIHAAAGMNNQKFLFVSRQTAEGVRRALVLKQFGRSQHLLQQQQQPPGEGGLASSQGQSSNTESGGARHRTTHGSPVVANEKPQTAGTTPPADAPDSMRSRSSSSSSSRSSGAASASSGDSTVAHANLSGRGSGSESAAAPPGVRWAPGGGDASPWGSLVGRGLWPRWLRNMGGAGSRAGGTASAGKGSEASTSLAADGPQVSPSGGPPPASSRNGTIGGTSSPSGASDGLSAAHQAPQQHLAKPHDDRLGSVRQLDDEAVQREGSALQRGTRAPPPPPLSFGSHISRMALDTAFRLLLRHRDSYSLVVSRSDSHAVFEAGGSKAALNLHKGRPDRWVLEVVDDEEDAGATARGQTLLDDDDDDEEQDAGGGASFNASSGHDKRHVCDGPSSSSSSGPMMSTSLAGLTPIFRVPGLTVELKTQAGHRVRLAPAFLSLQQLHEAAEAAKASVRRLWLTRRRNDREAYQRGMDVYATTLAGLSQPPLVVTSAPGGTGGGASTAREVAEDEEADEDGHGELPEAKELLAELGQGRPDRHSATVLMARPQVPPATGPLAVLNTMAVGTIVGFGALASRVLDVVDNALVSGPFAMTILGIPERLNVRADFLETYASQLASANRKAALAGPGATWADDEEVMSLEEQLSGAMRQLSGAGVVLPTVPPLLPPLVPPPPASGSSVLANNDAAQGATASTTLGDRATGREARPSVQFSPQQPGMPSTSGSMPHAPSASNALSTSNRPPADSLKAASTSRSAPAATPATATSATATAPATGATPESGVLTGLPFVRPVRTPPPPPPPSARLESLAGLQMLLQAAWAVLWDLKAGGGRLASSVLGNPGAHGSDKWAVSNAGEMSLHFRVGVANDTAEHDAATSSAPSSATAVGDASDATRHRLRRARNAELRDALDERKRSQMTTPSAPAGVDPFEIKLHLNTHKLLGDTSDDSDDDGDSSGSGGSSGSSSHSSSEEGTSIVPDIGPASAWESGRDTTAPAAAAAAVTALRPATTAAAAAESASTNARGAPSSQAAAAILSSSQPGGAPAPPNSPSSTDSGRSGGSHKTSTGSHVADTQVSAQTAAATSAGAGSRAAAAAAAVAGPSPFAEAAAVDWPVARGIILIGDLGLHKSVGELPWKAPPLGFANLAGLGWHS